MQASHLIYLPQILALLSVIIRCVCVYRHALKKHSSAGLAASETNRQTDRQTDGETDTHHKGIININPLWRH